MNAETREMLKLQTVDLQLMNLRRELEQIPTREEEIRVELHQLKELADQADHEVIGLEKQSRSVEHEVECHRESQRRLKDKKMEVKTNKEYHAILAEIDFLEKQIYEKEDKILELMEEMQSATRQAKKNRETFEEFSRKLQEELKRLADSRIFLKREIEEGTVKRDLIASELPKHLLDLFNRRAASCSGMPMSEARDEICQVCHVRVRPQVYQELRDSDILHQCDSCTRILYRRGEDEL